MSANNEQYCIDLWHEAYFSKRMEITAENLSEACKLAIECADDDSDWEDTFVSSTHWIESINDGAHSVPEACSAAAIRCGGAVLVANQLRETLMALVQTCESKSEIAEAIHVDLEQAKAILQKAPVPVTTD